VRPITAAPASKPNPLPRSSVVDIVHLRRLGRQGWASTSARGGRRASLAALQERAERLDRERELLAERAVAEERVRIARELHDVVAHNVSLIVVKAQALGATVPDDRVAERPPGSPPSAAAR
jgi:signal transduction histidine kinase